MSEVAAQVQEYLDRTHDTYPPDSDAFYARIALSAALNSYRKGNFGLGAVAVVRWGSRVGLYHGENGMAKPNAVVDHAEAHALLRVAAGETPDRVIELPQPATDPDQVEVTVYGTVEPCPMCVRTDQRRSDEVGASSSRAGSRSTGRWRPARPWASGGNPGVFLPLSAIQPIPGHRSHSIGLCRN